MAVPPDDVPNHFEAISGFKWYGAKLMHLELILPRLPKTQTYVEPYAGSASVLLNRPPDAAEVEVLNDLDEEVTTFFSVLRDRPGELVERLLATPYARAEYERAVRAHANPPDDPVERARLFFVRSVQSYTGMEQNPSEGAWSYSRKQARKGKSTRVHQWESKIDDLREVAARLRDVQIECDDALAVIDRYDHEDCLHYVDPPYVHDTRNDSSDDVYVGEMTADNHRELCEVLRGCEGHVALSGYPNDIYAEELEANGWHRHESEQGISTGDEGNSRVEALWTNYDPDTVARPHVQRTLFDH